MNPIAFTSIYERNKCLNKSCENIITATNGKHHFKMNWVKLLLFTILHFHFVLNLLFIFASTADAVDAATNLRYIHGIA